MSNCDLTIVLNIKNYSDSLKQLNSILQNYNNLKLQILIINYDPLFDIEYIRKFNKEIEITYINPYIFSTQITKNFLWYKKYIYGKYVLFLNDLDIVFNKNFGEQLAFDIHNNFNEKTINIYPLYNNGRSLDEGIENTKHLREYLIYNFFILKHALFISNKYVQRFSDNQILDKSDDQDLFLLLNSLLSVPLNYINQNVIELINREYYWFDEDAVLNIKNSNQNKSSNIFTTFNKNLKIKKIIKRNKHLIKNEFDSLKNYYLSFVEESPKDCFTSCYIILSSQPSKLFFLFIIAIVSKIKKMKILYHMTFVDFISRRQILFYLFGKYLCLNYLYIVIARFLYTFFKIRKIYKFYKIKRN